MSAVQQSGLVSIIVPVYNRPEHLIEAVESAASQDYESLEILIIDDGSTDGRTPEAATRLAGRYPAVVTVHRIPNGGPGLAREYGRQLSRGEFIQYLDSDDVLLPGKLTAQVAALRSQPEADVAYGVTQFRNADGRLIMEPHKRTGRSFEKMFPEFLNDRWWDTSTPLYRASICVRAGSWADLRLEEDWEYDCRIAAVGGRLAYCPIPVSETRDHGEQRLCRGAALDPNRLAMRARAHTLVWTHAQRAGLPQSHPQDVARFGQALFLLARQCGAAGLEAESRGLLGLAAEAATQGRASKQIPVYRALAALVGHVRAGRIAVWTDGLRSPSKASTPEAG